MAIKRGIEKAVEAAVEELKRISKPTKDQEKSPRWELYRPTMIQPLKHYR